MPNWKKVAVSGSDVAFASVTSSNGIINYGRLTLDGNASPREIVFSNNIASWQDGSISGATLDLRYTNTRRVFINSTGVQLTGSVGVLGTLTSTSHIEAGENLKSLYSAGDEGGQIFLNKPVTSTSINSGVNIDVYQNKLRFWEDGGTNRGFYLDITAGGTGVGTNLASGGGTVTSVSASGTVSGITLGGGPITGAGTLTLSGTISGLTNSNLSGTAGITNANLANSTITIAGTSTSLGGSIAQSTILAGSGVFSGSAQISGLTNSNLSGTAGITNANLANSSVTIGSTAISLGGTSTTLAGLSSVTSTTFVGALTGNASTATTAATASKVTTGLVTTNATHYIPFVDTNYLSNGTNFLGTINGLTYNPSSAALTTTTFVGALTGNATTATTAATASTISITATDATSATYYPVFVDGQTGARISRTDSGFTFNSLTNALTLSAGSLTATTINATTVNATASYASQSGYTMDFVLATTGSNLAASTTYRMGAPVRNQLTTVSGRTRIYVPRPGKVRYAHLYIRTNGTLASAGTSTLSLGKNSSVSEVISTSTSAGSSADATVSSTAISMSVALGDFLEINWVTPAWGTLPTAVEANGIIYIENNA